VKRVRRRLFNLAAVVSLVLCVAMAALWVRSLRGRWESIGHNIGGHRFEIQLVREKICFKACWGKSERQNDGMGTVVVGHGFGFAGIHYDYWCVTFSQPGGPLVPSVLGSGRWLRVPLAWPLALATLLPARSLMVYLRSRKRRLDVQTGFEVVAPRQK
jgi:hypothetical protein